MKSGYHGKKDAMREGAERAIGKAARMAEGEEKESKSAMSKIPPRPYKEGGKVKKCNFGGLLKSEYAPTGTVSISKPAYGSALKKGGSVKKVAIGGAMRHSPEFKKVYKEAMENRKGKTFDRVQSPGFKKAYKEVMEDYKNQKESKGVKKMAIGGVGKIRHKQSTKEGKPKKPR